MSERGVISVFGSSAPVPGSEVYELARETGRLLAQSGFAVATGGYSGVMSGVSQGAAEAGGHVIGVTSSKIESFRPEPPNRWVLEELKYDTLRERLMHLVFKNDGMIALPGGIGTLSEIALAWSLLQVGEMPDRPLILVGQLWQDTMKAFIRSEFVREPHQRLIHLVQTPAEAIALLKSPREAAGG